MPSVSSDSSDSTDSESSPEKNTDKPPQQETEPAAIIKPLSEQEMNQLGAKILKAELMGNEVNKLNQSLHCFYGFEDILFVTNWVFLTDMQDVLFHHIFSSHYCTMITLNITYMRYVIEWHCQHKINYD